MSKDDDLVRGPAPLLHDDLVVEKGTIASASRPGNFVLLDARAEEWVGADLGDMPNDGSDLDIGHGDDRS